MKINFFILPLLCILVFGIVNYSYAELEETKEDLVYLSLDENPELVKERISNAFWENPLNTPPMLILIAGAGVGVIIAWRRKWHVHESPST